MGHKKKIISVIGASLILSLTIASLWQQEIMVIPEKHLVVVDADMYPLQGVHIEQTWQHYTYESSQHVETLQTDQQGRATIPIRKIKISMLRKYLYPVWNCRYLCIHAGWGPDDLVIVDLYKTGAKVNSNKVIPLETEMVYKKSSHQGW